jgi:hypothetical protein
MVQSQPFLSRTLHGRLKKRPEPSENDRCLENGLSYSSSYIYSHSETHEAEGGHCKEVGLGLWLAELRLIAFFIRM